MTTDTPTYTLTDRADLLGYVPYLLGFHPADSVVVMGLNGRRISVTARADLARPQEAVRRVSRLLAGAGRGRSAVASVLLVGYGPDPSAADVTRELADALDARGYHVREVLLHAGDRYHCLQCEQCTPPGGEPFDPKATAGAAIATYEGFVAQPDRESIERMVRPIGGLAAIAMAQAVDRAEIRLTALLSGPADRDTPGSGVPSGLGEEDGHAPGSGDRDGLGEGGRDALLRAGEAAIDGALRIARAGGRLDDDEAAWLTVLLLDLRCRDHAWQRTDNEPWQQDLWLDLTRRGEPGLLAPVATLLAWCAWRSGNGVLAGAALRRALLADPAYSLAHLLTEALDQGLPPDAVQPWPAR